MGTWDATVLGNDTSVEVYDVFFEQYDRGTSLVEIEALIAKRFKASLSLAEDKHNVLFARALANWEIGTLTDALRRQVEKAIERGTDLAAWRSLGANEETLRKRSKVLAKLVEKLSVPRPSARKRKKTPVPLATKLVAGACASFRRSPRVHGGVIVIDSAFYPGRGAMRVAATSIAQAKPPTFRDFERCKLHGFSWEEVSGQAAKYATANGMTGRLSTLSLGYDSRSAAAPFFERVNRFFEVIGQLPVFTQVLLGTMGGTLDPDDGTAATNLWEFRSLNDEVSTEPLATLAPLLSQKRRSSK